MGAEFNKYMDATFDYLDQRLANSIKVNETFNSKMFRQEMHQAFLRKTDPIDFVEDFIRDQKSWGMGEAVDDDVVDDTAQFGTHIPNMPHNPYTSKTCPECRGAGFSIGGPEGQYDECPNCTDPKTGATLPPERWRSTASDAGSKPSGLTQGHDSIAAVFGKKSEALGDSGSRSARGFGKSVFKQQVADPDREGTCAYCGQDAYCSCPGGPNSEGGDWCEVCNQTGGNPECKYCRDAEKEMGRAEHMFGQNEAHGERAANRGPTNGRAARQAHRIYNEPKIAAKDARNTKSPDFGEEPGDEMFFGTPGQEDAVGTMLDPQSPSDEFKGGKVNDFSADNSDEPGFGDSSDDFLDTSHVSDDDVDSIWGPDGHQELPGSDVQFPEYDPEDPDAPMEPKKDYYGRPDPWGRKQRQKYVPPEDNRRKGIGDDEKYTGDRFINFMDKGWRKAMGYEEGIKQDRGSAADAQHRDMKNREKNKKPEPTQEFEFDPQSGDLKRSN
jgi:hypothetical protein